MSHAAGAIPRPRSCMASAASHRRPLVWQDVEIKIYPLRVVDGDIEIGFEKIDDNVFNDDDF